MSGEGSARHQDELTLKQQRRIEREICESRPLVDEPEPATRLAAEYDNDPVYAAKAQDLAHHYSALRKTRPDGNCFFRAFAYAYLERLVEEPDRFRAFERLVADSKDRLVRLGFAQFTVEDFYEIFMEVVHRIGEEIKKSVPDAHRELHKIFNEQGYSDYIVVYLRLVTSGQLQTDSDFYQNFIDGDRTVSEFCHQEVEPMYKESDHIHIIALCTALNVGVRVRYMDRGEGAQVIAHDFPEGVTPTVHLLYRPGHYDILYL